MNVKLPKFLAQFDLQVQLWDEQLEAEKAAELMTKLHNELADWLKARDYFFLLKVEVLLLDRHADFPIAPSDHNLH